MPSPMPRRRSRRPPPPPPESDASPLPVPSPPPPATASPSAASSRSSATSPPPPAAAASTGRSPPPPAAASTSRSPPLPWTPPPAAASTSRSPPRPWTPPPATASTSRSPPLPSSPPPVAASTSQPSPLLCSPPPAAASTSQPPPRHDLTPSRSLHHQLQPPRELFTDIDGVSRRLVDVNVTVEGCSYSRPQLPPCEDTEQAVRIEAPPSPNHFPPVSALMPRGLLIKYFLRVDAGGLFHTYPHRGGPFKSLQEAQDAIYSYHINLCKFKYLGGLSKEDRYVWHTLYWRNGTRKNSKEALDVMMNYNPTREVVKALLDKHNEDHLLEDLAYEIKKVVSYKAHFPRKGSQHECRSFSHLNVLVERGPNAIEDLLFIEMTCTTDGEFEEYTLSCICVVSSEDDDLHCQ
ncbi:hypothetical protein VPH35_081001 [Triticum aestivum]